MKNIYAKLNAVIHNPYGTCGLMGNMQAESGMVSTNMQNSYENKLGMNDTTYTQAVDNGSYANFASDRVGYGLCQWTSSGRKNGLLNYARSKNRSIGDEDMQIEYLLYELSTSYKYVLDVLKTATSVKEASDIVITRYERPAVQSAEALTRRASLGEAIYNELIKEETNMFKVCIDPGHYGKSNRSPGVPEYYESEMVWKLSYLQKKYLEQLGVEVVMTRTSQTEDMALQSRGKASIGCNVFISNHSNAVGNGMNENIDHVAVYHLADDDTTEIDDISKELAQRIAPIIAQVMGVEDGYKVLQRKAQSDRNKDGILNDNYYGVLHGARLVNTPGLILEHGFHTHTATVMWLMDDNNLDMLARAEAQIIYDFLLEQQNAIKVAQPILRKGSKGYQVTLLQENLNDVMNSNLSVDGNFGSLTEEVLIAFQGKYGLDKDGKYGPASYAAMKTAIESPSKEENAPEEISKIKEPIIEEEKTCCVHIGGLSKERAIALRDKLEAEGYDVNVI